jgi:hypothetical protein
MNEIERINGENCSEAARLRGAYLLDSFCWYQHTDGEYGVSIEDNNGERRFGRGASMEQAVVNALAGRAPEALQPALEPSPAKRSWLREAIGRLLS